MKVPGLILGLLLLPCIAQAQQQQYYGTPVASVTLSGVDSQADLQAIPIRVGDILTPENVRATIEALYNTGHYSAPIEADAVPTPDGKVALTFRVSPNYFISTVRLEPENLFERSLSNYVRIPVGEKFSKLQLDRIVEQTTDVLRTEGYFQAAITPEFQRDEPNRLISITLKVNPGVKARVGEIRITGGEQTFTQEELLDAFRLSVGDEYSGAKVDKGVVDIRQKFTELRFLNTRVTSDRMYDAAMNTVALNINIQPGQFALVQTRGFDISKKKLTELVPIFEEAAFDPDLVEEGRVAIRRYLQQEGYFEADVTFEIIEVDPTLGNAVQINYIIMPGAKHELVAVRISGNYYFSSDEIKRRIKTRRSEFFGHGTFSSDLLDEDRRTIEGMYRNAGFEDVVVTATPMDVDHSITVFIEIQEGNQLPITAIDITGNSYIDSAELLKALVFKPGDTYTPVLIDQGRAALTQLYYSRGFADVRVERRVERDDANMGVRVSFQITEGESYLLGAVLVSGNTITRDKVIRRTSRLQEYKPFNPESILEAQQRLYATGLFSRVEIVPLNQGIPNTRNVLIQVEDAKPILLTYGVGYQEFEHLRGTFEISHNNLFGLNRSLTFRTKLSSRERLAQATYHEPRLANHDLDGYASSFIEHSERPFFTANRIDFSLQVLKRFSVQSNFLTTASWQTVNVNDVGANPHSVNDPTQQGPCQVCQIGRIGMAYIRDWRDDALNPTKGTFNTTTFQVANTALGSELNFTTIYHQTAFYQAIRSGVLATSLRFGWVRPYGKTAQFVTVWNESEGQFVTQTQQLPATERYFAGGSTTLRGFSLDNARPPADPQLEGGNVMTIANVEYRIPLRRFPISNVGGAIFYDTGNVFGQLADFHLSQFTHSAGFGLRYQTPVGPARLDFGFNLGQPRTNPDGTPAARMKVFFTLGNPF